MMMMMMMMMMIHTIGLNNDIIDNDRITMRAFSRFIWRMQDSAKQPLTLRPSQPTWAVSSPIGCNRLLAIYYYSARFWRLNYSASIAPTWQFRLSGLLREHRFTYLLTWPESRYSFYLFTAGRRLSRPRHYSKSMQCSPWQGCISQWLLW